MEEDPGDNPAQELLAVRLVCGDNHPLAKLPHLLPAPLSGFLILSQFSY